MKISEYDLKRAIRRFVELGLKAKSRMPTDPTKFEGLRPSAARVLAEIIDNVDEAADPAALMGNCDFEVELANAIAGQIDEGLGDAAELRTLGLPATLAKSIAVAINESRGYPSRRT